MRNLVVSNPRVSKLNNRISMTIIIRWKVSNTLLPPCKPDVNDRVDKIPEDQVVRFLHSTFDPYFEIKNTSFNHIRIQKPPYLSFLKKSPPPLSLWRETKDRYLAIFWISCNRYLFISISNSCGSSLPVVPRSLKILYYLLWENVAKTIKKFHHPNWRIPG